MAERKVQLFFLGLPGVKNLGQGSQVRLMGGRTVALPPVGEYLYIEETYAKDLMRRYNLPGAEFHPFTLSRQIAKGRKAALAEIERGNTVIHSEKEFFTKEDVEAMLKKFQEKEVAEKSVEQGNTVEIPDGEPVEDEPEEELEAATPDAPRRGRPKKDE